MELAKNKFTHAIAAGEKQIGLWVTLANSFVAEVTAHSGYDWAVIDMEHSPNDYFTVLGQLQAFSSSGTTALVRPEWNDPVIIKRLLDLGAPGFVFPMIESVEEAQKAVAATRYPPKGIRGVSGSLMFLNPSRHKPIRNIVFLLISTKAICAPTTAGSPRVSKKSDIAVCTSKNNDLGD